MTLPQAKAIRAKGIAEAEVLAAKYKALGTYKDIYLGEMQRDTVTMLHIYIYINMIE